MSSVWPSVDVGSVISRSMFCPHMVLLSDAVVHVGEHLALHVCKQNRQ